MFIASTSSSPLKTQGGERKTFRHQEVCLINLLRVSGTTYLILANLEELVTSD